MDLKNELIVFLSAGLPVTELRGSIPLGLVLGLSPAKTFILSVVGNILPVLPLLYFFKPLHNFFRETSIGKKLFDFILKRTQERAKLIEKYEFLGLMLLVAIPLPGTGAWTASITASVFGLKTKLAFVSIILGVFIAGIIVLSFSLGVSYISVK